MLFTRGTTVRFRGVTPTISSKQQNPCGRAQYFHSEFQWKELGRKRKLKDLAKGSTLQGLQGYSTEIDRKEMKRVMLEFANMTKTGFRVSTSNLARR
jgi:hypothetical protein